MKRFVTVVPSAKRLMSSLRDIGYDLPAAIADLVDNSIDAGASRIDITLHADAADSWVRIADDGLGMAEGALDEAMRYGSAGSYGPSSLGHFGLGLKTGSLSQCRRLTVASRRAPKGRMSARCWDLDTVTERDSWDLDAPRSADLPRHVLEPLAGSRGTVVVWEKLDRILAFRNPDGSPARRAMETMAEDIGAHLAMVFHRFLSGEWTGGTRAVEIWINGVRVEPWDPFARDEKMTRRLPQQVLVLPVDEDRVAELVVEPFVLPAQTQFSSAEAHQRAAGPNRWNRQQGFYIYRRERLIQSGGWNRIRTFDEHAKLARIAIDLPLGDEDLFGINVAKMSVSMPDGVRAPLRAIASAVVQEAQRSYRELLHDPASSRDFVGLEEVSDLGNHRASDSGPSIAGDWPVILRTVTEVLADEPVRRDQVLLRLANAFG